MNDEQLEAMRARREAQMREGMWDDDRPIVNGWLLLFALFAFICLLIYVAKNKPEPDLDAIARERFEQCLHRWPLAECQARKDAGAL